MAHRVACTHVRTEGTSAGPTCSTGTGRRPRAPVEAGRLGRPEQRDTGRGGRARHGDEVVAARDGPARRPGPRRPAGRGATRQTDDEKSQDGGATDARRDATRRSPETEGTASIMAPVGNRAAPGPRPFRKRGSVRCPRRRFPPRLGAGRAPGPLSSVAGVLHFWRSTHHGAPDGASSTSTRSARRRPPAEASTALVATRLRLGATVRVLRPVPARLCTVVRAVGLASDVTVPQPPLALREGLGHSSLPEPASRRRLSC